MSRGFTDFSGVTQMVFEIPHLEDPVPEDTDPAANGKEILVEMERSNPVEEHCTEVIKNIQERVDPRITKLDQWKEFHTEIREQHRAYQAQAGIPLEFPKITQDPSVTGGELQQVQSQSSENNIELLAHHQSEEMDIIPMTTAEHKAHNRVDKSISESVLEQQAPYLKQRASDQTKEHLAPVQMEEQSAPENPEVTSPPSSLITFPMGIKRTIGSIGYCHDTVKNTDSFATIAQDDAGFRHFRIIPFLMNLNW
ncbi:protein CPR-5-like [Dorcoceras hygrometricum]|uniref:Protein CPR-5-like n=1 Tax=Dorcoceras hygrometricum TaxID=472368 RepID=A0A2Z7ACN1_9LAMI|nr:protein CPR-5-like [Dorcoceras hygrometricum]